MCEILTIHEVRRILDNSLQIITVVNSKYIDGKMPESSDLRELYENLRKVATSRWTNQVL
jgi:hypothetical protein